MTDTITLTREEEIIKKAYREGFADGYHEACNLYKGAKSFSDIDCWIKSRAYKLTTNKEG